MSPTDDTQAPSWPSTRWPPDHDHAHYDISRARGDAEFPAHRGRMVPMVLHDERSSLGKRDRLQLKHY